MLPDEEYRISDAATVILVEGVSDAAAVPSAALVLGRDLEDELIRALGTERVLEVLEQNGDLERFRTFHRQPAKRAEPIDRQLHRFFGTTSGRKERYGRILVEALDGAHLPPPLADLLCF